MVINLAAYHDVAELSNQVIAHIQSTGSAQKASRKPVPVTFPIRLRIGVSNFLMNLQVMPHDHTPYTYPVAVQPGTTIKEKLLSSLGIWFPIPATTALPAPCPIISYITVVLHIFSYFITFCHLVSQGRNTTATVN